MKQKMQNVIKENNKKCRMWVRKTIQKVRRKIKFKSIIQICIWRLFFRKGKFLPFFMQKILIKQIGKYYKKSRKYPEVVYQLKKRGKTTSFEIVTEKCQNRFWRGRLPKVINTKYSKHWPYTAAHTIDCVCRKC